VAILKFLNYLRGYLVITIEGYFVEKFINLCSKRRIKIWDINKKNEGFLEAKIIIKDFFRIRKCVRTSKCRVRIKKKKGLVFLLKKYKKRKIFLISLITISIILVVNSMFIWNINYICEDEIDLNSIMLDLNEFGLKIGVLKASINEADIINKIRLKRDDIAWIGLDIKGTNLDVKIVKSIEKPEIIDESEHCSIVSNQDALITKITVQNGTAMVKEGDVVTKGDTLVLGIIEGKNVDDKYVHSQAIIEGKVWRTVKKKVSLNTTEKRKTGNSEKRFQIFIKNFQINLYKNDTKFKNYDRITEESKLKLGSSIYIPIAIVKNEYIETENINKVLTIEEAKEKAIKLAQEELDLKVPEASNIINKNLTYYEGNDYIEIELTYESIEEIGIKQKI